jgi:hypothetical protein
MELRQHASCVRPAHAAHLQLETADRSIYSHFGRRVQIAPKIMSIAPAWVSPISNKPLGIMATTTGSNPQPLQRSIAGFAFATRNWREEDETEGSENASDRKCSINVEGYGCRHRIWIAFISKVKAMRREYSSRISVLLLRDFMFVSRPVELARRQKNPPEVSVGPTCSIGMALVRRQSR